MKLDLREDKYGKTKGIKNIRKASDEVLRDTIDTNSKSKQPARAELERRKRTDADDEKQGEETPVEEPAEKEAEKPAEKDAEKDSEKPAEEPEETPDEEPKDEPEEPESDSTDSEDDESDDESKADDEKVKKEATAAQKKVTSKYQAKIDKLLKQVDRLEKSNPKAYGSKFLGKLLEIASEPPAKMIGVDFDGFDENTKTFLKIYSERLKQKATRIKNKKTARAAEIKSDIAEFDELVKTLGDPDKFSKTMSILRKNGINNVRDFEKLSKDERAKLFRVIDEEFKIEEEPEKTDAPEETPDETSDDTEGTPDDEKEDDGEDEKEDDGEDEKEDEGDDEGDEKEEEPKKKTKNGKTTNESYYGMRGVLQEVYNRSDREEKYPSMRTILNRMYGEQK